MNVKVTVGRASRNFVLTMAVCGALLLGAASSASAGTLDQQQALAPGTGLQVQSTQSVAQTFTAGLSGGLDRVDLHLAAAGTGVTLPLTVEIRNASAGSPGTTVLATATVPPSAVTSSAAFVPVSFATPAPVTAGTQYAIVTYSADVIPHIWTWSNAAMNPYPAGGSFFQAASPPTGTWNSFAGFDQTFRTYVAVPTPPATGPTPAPTTPAKKKPKKCKKKKKHKRSAESAKKKHKKCKKHKKKRH